MNNLITIFLLCVACFTLGCDSSPDCGDHGRLNNESCVCDAFFEGELCDQEIRDKYTGVWTTTFRCSLSPNNVFTHTDFIITTTEIDSIVIRSEEIFDNFPMQGKLIGSTEVSITPFNPQGTRLYEARLVELATDSLRLIIDDSFVFDSFWPCQYTLTR